MKKVKKISEMTDDEITKMDFHVLVEKSLKETVDEINLDTEYMGDALKHIFGSLLLSFILLPLTSVSYFFLLPFLLPIFFTYVFGNIVKHRNFYINLLYSEHQIYSDTGEFNQDFLDSFVENLDLDIKL